MTPSAATITGLTARSSTTRSWPRSSQRPAGRALRSLRGRLSRPAWQNSTSAMPGIGQLAYFGLMPEFIGRRLGYFFLYHADRERLGEADHEAAGQHLHAGSPPRAAALSAPRLRALQPRRPLHRIAVGSEPRPKAQGHFLPPRPKAHSRPSQKRMGVWGMTMADAARPKNDIVRPPARADVPLHHRDVGALFLLRHARDPRSLPRPTISCYDPTCRQRRRISRFKHVSSRSCSTAGARSRVQPLSSTHLRQLHGVRLSDAVLRRLHRGPLARPALQRDHRRPSSWPSPNSR